MKVLAVIPARGGSKGIPRKNLADFLGRPLVAWSVKHALDAQTVQRVLVSTDDEEIAEVARAAGAEVPFVRPRPLAEDHVLDLPVFAHALEQLEADEGYRPDLVVHLRPTCPWREEGWIDEAVRLLADSDADSLRSVSTPAAHPYRIFQIEDGVLAPFVKDIDEPYLLRRQDHPPVYHYNCVIDVTRPSTIDGGSMTGARMLPYVLPAARVVDIDSAHDLWAANRLFAHPDEIPR